MSAVAAVNRRLMIQTPKYAGKNLTHASSAQTH